jgi:hypothetical protein
MQCCQKSGLPSFVVGGHFTFQAPYLGAFAGSSTITQEANFEPFFIRKASGASNRPISGHTAPF